MRVSTGRWVVGEDFFDRSEEVRILATLIEERNHVLITGQRRMGKTSIVRELGRTMQMKGWTTLFVDVEGATCAEDVIALIAKAAHPTRPIASRFASSVKRLIQENLEEISAGQFGVTIRSGLNEGNWRHHGEQLFRACAQHENPVLLAIDELPIFLKRMLRVDANAQRVEEFLSWLRSLNQALEETSPILVVSGSIGLEPLVRSLGLSDRINYLYPFRLGPWSRGTSVQCFNRLASENALYIQEGVAEAVYESLGIGIPHHVQSFFARLRDFAAMHDRQEIAVEDVAHVYRNELLGPLGQNDLVHYESRLRDGLGEENYSIAMEILAEASIENVFSFEAKLILEDLYSRLMKEAGRRISDTIEILVHDGYLELQAEGYRFPSRLLKDWWCARFRDHHVALRDRPLQVEIGDPAHV